MPRRRRKREPGVASRRDVAAASRAFSRWLVLALFAVVAIAVAAAHWPALSAEAQCFDDGQYLTDNPLIQNPSWNSAWRFLTEVFEPSTVGGYYEPLDMISLMLDYAMTGRAECLNTSWFVSLADAGRYFATVIDGSGNRVSKGPAGFTHYKDGTDYTYYYDTNGDSTLEPFLASLHDDHGNPIDSWSPLQQMQR